MTTGFGHNCNHKAQRNCHSLTVNRLTFPRIWNKWYSYAAHPNQVSLSLNSDLFTLLINSTRRSVGEGVQWKPRNMGLMFPKLFIQKNPGFLKRTLISRVSKTLWMNKFDTLIQPPVQKVGKNKGKHLKEQHFPFVYWNCKQCQCLRSWHLPLFLSVPLGSLAGSLIIRWQKTE